MNLEFYKSKAESILSPIKPATNESKARQNFLFNLKRSNGGRNLPEYYLVYFLFAELLGYKNLGRFEKVAWSFPIDFNGKAFIIEYRKFGLGVFIQDASDENDAAEIAKKVSAAVKAVRPFFDYIAEEAVHKSQFSIMNNNKELFSRFDFLLKLFKQEFADLQQHRKQANQTPTEPEEFQIIEDQLSGAIKIRKASNWLAISSIEAFFSWTEHLFIHIAVIAQGIHDGKTIAELIDSEWKTKFTTAIPLSSDVESKFYNELLLVRQQLRNFVAHGAFGKKGNAFKFHSGTGAVPVIMNHTRTNRFSLVGTLEFKEAEVIKLIEDFISFLWNGQLKPVMNYTQETDLPTILPYAADGRYLAAAADLETMDLLIYALYEQFDNAANMDW